MENDERGPKDGGAVLVWVLSPGPSRIKYIHISNLCAKLNHPCMLTAGSVTTTIGVIVFRKKSSFSLLNYPLS